MADLARQEVITSTELLVVKVGSRVLSDPAGALDVERIAQLADGVVSWREAGRRVAVVSSGAVAAGVDQLGLPTRPSDLAHLQAVAAIGQTRLIEAYDRTFRQRGRRAAQVLLTADDLEHRARYLNVRNTLLTLLEMGAIPVINENDTVAVDELQTTFGDNDRLASLVTNLLGATLLVVLSDVDGLYDGDPGDPQARLLTTVTRLDESVMRLARDRGEGPGKGGMASKLAAAQTVTAAGENVIVAGGRQERVLQRLLDGETLGTLFLAQGKTVTPWKRWIGFSARPQGRLLLDEGACRAIREQGRSLLAIGLTAVQGVFAKGDVVSLCTPEGRELARGLSNYDSGEVERIRGCRSEQIAERLGHRPYEEVVHRDNLLVMETR